MFSYACIFRLLKVLRKGNFRSWGLPVKLLQNFKFFVEPIGQGYAENPSPKAYGNYLR